MHACAQGCACADHDTRLKHSPAADPGGGMDARLPSLKRPQLHQPLRNARERCTGMRE
jgi:hypothetical protein